MERLNDKIKIINLAIEVSGHRKIIWKKRIYQMFYYIQEMY